MKNRRLLLLIPIFFMIVLSGCSITSRTTTSTDDAGNIIDKKRAWQITTPLGSLGSLEEEDEQSDDQ